MRTIRLEPPEVGERSVVFRWSVEPRSDLYVAESFDLRFGEVLDTRTVPDDIWWTVALICLHNHWPLLRPCRVELPVELAPGEREFWLRLTDATVETLELTRGGHDLERTIEIDDRGPRLEPAPGPGGSRAALGFSGGKDSLLTLELLREFGERPVAVTTTSPMWPLVDHASPRRRTVMERVASLPDVDHFEVRSTYRQCWDNTFARTRGYEVAVSELNDTMLYAAATMAVAYAKGADRILLASEAEVQETTEVDGILVQHPHLMYSAVTQRSLGRLLARRGLGYGSLTYPMHAWQIHTLLWERYPDLSRYQYSCWQHARGEGACSACRECLKTALTALEAGVSPRVAGIDVARLFDELAEWQPRVDGGSLPDERARRNIHGATVRQLQRMRTRRAALTLARTDPRQLIRRGALQMLRNYSRLRANAGTSEPVPDEGHRPAYLEFVDPRWRGRMEAFLDANLERAPAAAERAAFERAAARVAKIAEPLGKGG